MVRKSMTLFGFFSHTGVNKPNQLGFDLFNFGYLLSRTLELELFLTGVMINVSIIFAQHKLSLMKFFYIELVDQF